MNRRVGRVAEFQFDRRGAAKDHDPYAQPALFVIHFFNNAFKVVKRSIRNAHHLTGFVEHLRFGLVDAILNALQDRLGFLFGNWCWLVTGSTDETQHLGRLANRMPGFIIQFHLNQYVAGKEFTVALALLTIAHLDDFFSGDQNLPEPVINTRPANPFQQGAPDLLLKTGVSLDYIPAHRHTTLLTSDQTNQPKQQDVQ